MELLPRRALVLAPWLLLTACGASPLVPDAPLPDASVDATPDTAMDASPDAPMDASPDASVDTREDALTDAPTDLSTDLTTDAPTDVPTDRAMDTGSRDAPLDAGADVSRDGALDAPGDTALDTTSDANADATGDAPSAPYVVVSHERELRAAWVATVSNIDFPTRTGLTAAAQRAELTAILDTASRVGLNALFFQVRPEGDAVYRSSLEPWSRWLTGRQGGDPGWDPLETLVAEAHRRGIEVHAWFNPYRARATASATSVSPHLSITHPEAMILYDGKLWMDPGSTVVQDRTVAVITDVVRRYDVDGVHFDDYFYPYPASGTGDFGDTASWDAYRASGGALSRADWRRDNVNTLVRRVSATVASLRPDVRFGISPFGIYRPGTPPGITGLDAYNAIYCDPPRWLREGWVDYLAPQLYWPSTQTAQAYGPLLRWWAGQTSNGRSIFAGNALYRLGTTSAWTLDELRTQVNLTRAERPRGALGNVYFSFDDLRSNHLGAADALQREFYARPALTPPLATAPRATVLAPRVTASGTTLSVSHPAPTTLRAWALYRYTAPRWNLERVSPASVTSLTVTSGRWAVSAVSRAGVESLGYEVTVP